jgi:type IV secretion system protein VirB11
MTDKTSLSALLYKNLEILAPYLKKKNIVEISINKPGEVWIETVGDGWKHIKDKNLTLNKLLSLAKILATESNQDFNDETPILSLSIPEYNYRLQVISGNAVDSGFALSIRVTSEVDIPLSSWFDKNTIETLKQQVDDRKTIIVSGGTGSGKTTLLNSILRLISNNDRIVTLEDSKELVIKQPNHIRLLKSKTGTDIAQLSYKDFINVIMRMRPDRILLGEIDVENTINFLRLINTGHNGSFATIHANTIDSAIEAIVLNCQLSGFKGSEQQVKSYAFKNIDVIIQAKRQLDKDGKRSFTADVKVLH